MHIHALVAVGGRVHIIEACMRVTCPGMHLRIVIDEVAVVRAVFGGVGAFIPVLYLEAYLLQPLTGLFRISKL